MIGSSILSFDIIDSTNDYIKNNLHNSENGLVVTAQQQTKGRGQFNNSWESPLGNLYFSFLLKQAIQHEGLFQLHIIVSLTIIHILKKYGIHSKIKYPNDIIVNNKKIAGILIETSGYELIDSIIIGVGINLNQIDFGELNEKATSIKKETGLNCINRELLNHFIEIYNNFKYNQHLYQEYLLNSDTIGKSICYNDQMYTIKNILPNGNLLLTNEFKAIEIHYGKISLSEMYF